jgi:hypothetical protein
MLNFVMLGVFTLCDFRLSHILSDMLSVIIAVKRLSVQSKCYADCWNFAIMLIVVLPNVVAPVERLATER